MAFQKVDRIQKNNILFDNINEYEYDILNMVEVNLKHNKLKDEKSIANRTLGWYESITTCHAYKYCSTLDRVYQVGGTGIWAINKASHHVFGSVIDPSGLGRWNWVSFQGKDGYIGKKCTVYVPHTLYSGGTNTVYA